MDTDSDPDPDVDPDLFSSLTFKDPTKNELKKKFKVFLTIFA
jgi:hypothetical protein